MDLYHKVN